MSKRTLDAETADRLLSGTLHPDDAPPGFASVSALLRAAARTGSPSPIDQQRVAAMAAMIAGQAAPGVRADKAKKTKGRSLRRRARVGALLVAGTLFGTAGLAMAGALPPGMQSVAAKVLSEVGISAPGGNGPSTTTNPSASPAPTPTKGPNANGPAKFGLCNAFLHGQGGVNGNKNNSVAFQNLQNAAKAAGQSVQDFCKSATPGGKASPGHHGSANGHGNRGHHNGQHGPPPQSKGPGDGKGKKG